MAFARSMHVQRLMDNEIIGETDEHSLEWPQP